jgi:hypothetical protein
MASTLSHQGAYFPSLRKANRGAGKNGGLEAAVAFETGNPARKPSVRQPQRYFLGAT